MVPETATQLFTHLQASGNRRLSGKGAIYNVTPVDIDINGRPAWLLAAGNTDSYWTVVTAAGEATTHRVRDGTSEQVADLGAVSTPPFGYRTDERAGIVDAPADCAEFTHPIPIDGGLAYVATDGDVVLWQDETPTRLPVAAPPDARLVRVDDTRLAVYGKRSDNRYTHGALGDTIEGSSVAVVDTDAGRITTEIELDAPAVFEGLSPLLADLDGDSDPEIVTTVADTAKGARIRGATVSTAVRSRPARFTAPAGDTSSVSRRLGPMALRNSPSCGSPTSTARSSSTVSTRVNWR